MIGRATLLRSFGIALIALASMPSNPDLAPRSVGLFDHHLHLMTPAARDLLDSIQPGTPRVTAVTDVVEAMDSAGVHRGLLLSVAYAFSATGSALTDEVAHVQAENDFVAAAAREYPNRLVASCSVNPLASYAIDEVDRCLAPPDVNVLKLHFANSGVDLRSDRHLDRIATVFDALDRHQASAVVHLRTTSGSFGPRDARSFIDRVLAPSRVPIQIAHMGGWGGYDAVTDSVVGTFVEAITDGALADHLLWMDLGAVVFLPEAAGADSALVASIRRLNARLASRIHELGPERIVYGTDWPSWPPGPDPIRKITQNIQIVRRGLGLNDALLQAILTNEGILGLPRPPP